MPHSRIDEMPENLEARRGDEEAAAIAVERIRNGDADLKETALGRWPSSA